MVKVVGKKGELKFLQIYSTLVPVLPQGFETDILIEKDKNGKERKVEKQVELKPIKAGVVKLGFSWMGCDVMVWKGEDDL